jgi:hypothetical protein
LLHVPDLKDYVGKNAETTGCKNAFRVPLVPENRAKLKKNYR